MCGRFALYSPYPSLAASLHLPLEATEADSVPRYNVAPGTWITAVRRLDDEGPLVLDAVWWGYHPHWAGESAPEPINARVEKVATSKYFRGAFTHHRCLVPANGWFEWVRREVVCVIVRRSHSRPDLPSHRQYPTRYGGLVTSRLKALGQCSLRFPAGARLVRGGHACEHQRGSELGWMVRSAYANLTNIVNQEGSKDADRIRVAVGTGVPFSPVMGIKAAGILERPNPILSHMRNMVSPYGSRKGSSTVRCSDSYAGRGSGRKRTQGCNGSDTGFNVTRHESGQTSPWSYVTRKLD